MKRYVATYAVYKPGLSSAGDFYVFAMTKREAYDTAYKELLENYEASSIVGIFIERWPCSYTRFDATCKED